MTTTKLASTKCTGRLQKKEAKQSKHALKDQERISEGKVPEHTGEASMTKDYTTDPKFEVSRICGPPPRPAQQLVFNNQQLSVKSQKLAKVVSRAEKVVSRAGLPAFLGLVALASLAFVAGLIVSSGRRRSNGRADTLEGPLLA